MGPREGARSVKSRILNNHDVVISLTKLTLVLGCAASLAQLVILEHNIEAARHCAR